MTTKPGGADEIEPEDIRTEFFVPSRGEDLGGFRIVGPLGEGGLSDVFEATHPERSGRFAVKIAKALAKPKIQERFEREARILHSLRHENIVPALVSGLTPDGRGFLVMPLIEGRTLTDIVLTDGPIPEDEVAAIAFEVLQGLAAAHEALLVHRDLKPSNVLRSPNGRVAILDFGIARAFDGDQMRTVLTNGGLIGTPAFMAPEQILASSEVGPQADVYALGATICFLLSGEPPFTGSIMDVIHSHRFDEPPNLLPYGPIGEAAMAMLAKHPDDRPSVDQLLDALGAQAGPGTAVIDGESSTSSSTIGLALAAIVLIAALVTLILVFVVPVDDDRPLAPVAAPPPPPRTPAVVPRPFAPERATPLPPPVVVQEDPTLETPAPRRRRRRPPTKTKVAATTPKPPVTIDDATIGRRLDAAYRAMKRIAGSIPDAELAEYERRYLSLKETRASSKTADDRLALAKRIAALTSAVNARARSVQ